MNREVYKTGGGSNIALLVSPVDEATIKVMNYNTVCGHDNQYDDDVIEESAYDGIDIVEISAVENNFKDNDCFSPPFTQELNNTEWKSGTVCGKDLKSKKHVKLDGNLDKTEWISRRKPSITPTGNVVRKYEEVADIKKIVSETLLSNINAKEERDKEEHKLKIELIKLDIEIKKKELSKL